MPTFRQTARTYLDEHFGDVTYKSCIGNHLVGLTDFIRNKHNCLPKGKSDTVAVGRLFKEWKDEKTKPKDRPPEVAEQSGQFNLCLKPLRHTKGTCLPASLSALEQH